MSGGVLLIVACLRRYREHLNRSGQRSEPLRMVSPAELSRPTTADEVATLLDDPIRSALRGRVREIGWQAFARGGRDEMDRVAAAVEDAMSEAQSFAGSTLDKWWDGIGDNRGRWTA